MRTISVRVGVVAALAALCGCQSAQRQTGALEAAKSECRATLGSGPQVSLARCINAAEDRFAGNTPRDLVERVHTLRVELAEKIDRKQITQSTAASRLAREISLVESEDQARSAQRMQAAAVILGSAPRPYQLPQNSAPQPTYQAPVQRTVFCNSNTTSPAVIATTCY